MFFKDLEGKIKIFQKMSISGPDLRSNNCLGILGNWLSVPSPLKLNFLKKKFKLFFFGKNAKGAVPPSLFKARFHANPLPTDQFCWKFFCELGFGQIKNFWKKNCGFSPLLVISRQNFKTPLEPSFLMENGWIFLCR